MIYNEKVMCKSAIAYVGVHLPPRQQETLHTVAASHFCALVVGTVICDCNDGQ